MDTKFGGEGFWNVIVGEGFEVYTYTGCPNKGNILLLQKLFIVTPCI